jgi:hypothetical protein
VVLRLAVLAILSIPPAHVAKPSTAVDENHGLAA